MMKLKCPRCGSGQTYYRFKTDEIACRQCGKITSMAAMKMIIEELEENKLALEKKKMKQIEEAMRK